LEVAMNNRYGNERQRYGEFGPSNRDERSGSRRHQDDERSGWGRGEQGDGSGWGERYNAHSREPRFSSDYDETYGSEWQRGDDQPHRAFQQGREGGQGLLRQRGQGSYGQGYSGQRDESRPGWYSRGHAGTYGGGSGGGYQGGHGGSGYGGSTGTDYAGGSQGGFGGQGYGGQGGYGGRQGAGSALRSSQGGSFAGRGPKGYTRTDDRIREDVCDRLSMDDEVDASEIEVQVKDGEVTLEGSVQTRHMKHQAEDVIEDLPGVKDVHNRLRVMKGFLNELKDKVTGDEDQGHYANTGTKATAGAGRGATTSNGRV
jgi:osmotically-inducible protein OsmY